MQTEDYIVPVDIDYHDGQRYPVLVRDDSQKDFLDEITTPLTDEAKKAREAGRPPHHAAERVIRTTLGGAKRHPFFAPFAFALLFLLSSQLKTQN